jgi:hypothetical protein
MGIGATPVPLRHAIARQRERLDPRFAERPRELLLFFATPRPEERLELDLRPLRALVEPRDTLLERAAERGRVDLRPYSPRDVLLSPTIWLGMSKSRISFWFVVRLVLFLVLGISRSPCSPPRGLQNPRPDACRAGAPLHDACQRRQRQSAAG